MRTAQSTERAIYIPRGRRELIEATVVKDIQALKAKPSKRPMAEQSETQNKAARLVPSTESTTVTVLPTSAPEFKSAPVKQATAAIYVPKAKRDQMERDATNKTATVKKPTSVAVKSLPVTTRLEAPSGRDASSNRTRSVPVTQTTGTPSSASGAPLPESDEPNTASEPIASLSIGSNSTIGATTTTIKPKEAVRGGIYIPKGRRELNEKAPPPAPVPVTQYSSNDTKTSTSRTLTPPRAPRAEGNASAARSKTYSSWDDSSDENSVEDSSISVGNAAGTATSSSASSSVDDTIDRALLITVPSELTDTARGNIIRPYQDKGATIKWHSDTQCILMFKSERIAAASIPPPGCSIFRVTRLRDVSGAQKEDLLTACREAFPTTKPERDSSVANRLIGAALGIRLPKPVASASTSGGRRAPSPVREDAWD